MDERRKELERAYEEAAIDPGYLADVRALNPPLPPVEPRCVYCGAAESRHPIAVPHPEFGTVGCPTFAAAASRDEESAGTRIGRELRITHLERTVELLTAQLTAARAAETEAVRALAAAREAAAALRAEYARFNNAIMGGEPPANARP